MVRATIKDVAKLAGYSITTVSMVLNKKNISIPESTCKKILDAVVALNYRPNQLAVGMVTKKTKVLGLVIPDNSNLFFADLSKAIEMEAHKKGFSLLYGNTSNDHKRIGCCTGSRDLVNSNERLSGYRSALDEAHLPYDEALIYAPVPA